MSSGIWTPKSENPLALYDGDFVEITGIGVSKWFNQTMPNTYDLVQATDPNRPAYVASNAAFAGHGTITPSTVASMLTATLPMPNVCTIYCATQVSAAAQLTLLDSIGSRKIVGTYPTVPYIYNGGANLSAAAGVTAATPAVYCVSFDVTSSLWINNTTTGIVSGNAGVPTAATTGLVVGNDRGTGYAWGKPIAFVAVYAGAHDATTRRRIMRYLGEKYGIPIDRPIAEYDASPSGVRTLVTSLWTPLSESPIAMYDGDVGITPNGPNVAAWADQSGTGDANKNLLQGTPGDQPGYNATDADFNGHGSITFGIGGTPLATGVFGSPIPNPATWYIVGRYGATTNYQKIISGLSSGNRQDFDITTADKLNVFSGASVTATATTGYRGNLFVASPIFGAVAGVYSNSTGTNLLSGNCGALTENGFYLGSFNDKSSPFNGKIAFIAVYAGAHTASQRFKIMRYLSSKYGIAVDSITTAPSKFTDRMWNKSGIVEAAKDAVQNVETSMPLWTASDPDFNGEGSLTFGAGVLTTGAFAASMAQPTTTYAVLKGGTTTNVYLYDGLAPGGQNLVRMLSSTGVLGVYNGSAWVDGTFDARGANVSLCVVANAASSALYVNNAAVPNLTGSAGASPRLGITLGGAYDSTGKFTGKLAYYAVYQGAHDATQRQEIMATLSAKYGPPLNLLARYDGDTVELTGSKVNKWTDLGNSGDNANRHALQGVDANRPTYLASDPDFNGHGSLDFTGVQYLQTGTFSPAFAQPTTYYAVFLSRGGAANKVVVDGLSAAQRTLVYTGAGTPGYPLIASGANFQAPILLQPLTACIEVAVFNSTNSIMAFNNPRGTYTGDVGTGINTTGHTIGNKYDGSLPLNGKIARLDIYAGVHDLETRTRIMNELATKYGITLDEQSPILDASRDVLVTGQGVSKWSDQSLARDANKNALQTTDANRPAYITSDPDFNGKASIGFSGQQRLLTGDWAKPMVQPFTEVVVLKLPASIPSNMRILSTIKASGSGGGSAVLFTGVNTLKMYAGSAIVESSAVQPGTFAVVLVEYAGTASRIFLNNAVTPIATGSIGTGGASGRTFGGDYGDNYTFNGGKIAYYTNFPRTLSADERKALMDKLKAQYKPWSPLDESPSAYYDGDVVVQSGGLVSQWTDQGPSLDANRHATAAGAARPTWTQNDPDFGGHGSVAFSGGTYVRSLTWTSDLASTIYIVMKPNGFAGTSTIVGGITSAVHQHAVYMTATGSVNIWAGSVLAGTNSHADTKIIHCSQFSGATSACYLNSQVADASGASGAGLFNGITIGTSWDGVTPLSGKIAHVSVFPGVHSPELRARIMKWLSTRYNIPIDVPIAKYEPNAQGVVRYLGGNTISKLYNQSGIVEAAKDAVQATPAAMPTWIEKDPDFNGRGSLTFAGTQSIVTGAWASPATQPVTKYVVARTGSTAGSQVLYDGVTNTVQSHTVAGVLGTFAGVALPGPTLTPNTTYVFCFRQQGATSMVAANTPAEIYKGDAGATNTATGMTIGNSRALSTPWLGKIAHIVEYAGAHDFTTRDRIMRELGEQFNVKIYSPLDDLPLAYYDADYCRKYSATQVDRLYSLDGSGDANRHAKQDTAANMPTFIDNDPDFGGHRSIQGAASKWLKTGTFSSLIPQPCTYYLVGKWGNGATNEYLLDGSDADRHAIYSLNASTGYGSAYAGAPLSGAVSVKNTLTVQQVTFNGGSSSIYSNNVTTPYASGPGGAVVAKGLHLGIDSSETAIYSFLGKFTFIAVYPGAHDATQRARIMKFLGAKYGITVT